MDKFKRFYKAFICLFILLFLTIWISCLRKTGCPGEDAQVKVNKKGLPTSKPKSGLFDKKTMKKMGK